MKKALAERALNAEMDHLASEPGNSRNGHGARTVLTDTGRIDLAIPRDRQASFDPQPIAKYQRRFPGFDDKIVSMVARGMSTREITGHLRDLYGVEVSADLISTVANAVLEEVAAWQARPLEPIYPLVFFDALRVKIRDEGLVLSLVVECWFSRTLRAACVSDCLQDAGAEQLEPGAAIHRAFQHLDPADLAFDGAGGPR